MGCRSLEIVFGSGVSYGTMGRCYFLGDDRSSEEGPRRNERSNCTIRNEVDLLLALCIVKQN